jgi:hypothetical protein
VHFSLLLQHQLGDKLMLKFMDNMRLLDIDNLGLRFRYMGNMRSIMLVNKFRLMDMKLLKLVGNMEFNWYMGNNL